MGMVIVLLIRYKNWTYHSSDLYRIGTDCHHIQSMKVNLCPKDFAFVLVDSVLHLSNRQVKFPWKMFEETQITEAVI